MIATIVILFFFLLFMGMPIAVMLLITTTVTLAIHTNTSLVVIPQQLFNVLDNSILLSIPFFILAGNVMTHGAMARRLIDVVNSFVGSFPGGLAIAGTLACLFFAALSGSSPATVVAIGSIMIPALIKAGYGEKFSIGLLTSAGSLGIVVPPSIPMILYCLVMNTSVAELFMAGIVPGLLIGGSFIAYTVYLAHKNGWKPSQSITWGERLRTLKDGIWGVFLPVIVLGGIYAGAFTPTEAAAVSLVYALLVEICIYREIGIRDVPEVCIQGAVLSGCLLFILASAMTLIWLLTSQRLPHQIADLITAHVSSGWVFLILVNVSFPHPRDRNGQCLRDADPFPFVRRDPGPIRYRLHPLWNHYGSGHRIRFPHSAIRIEPVHCHGTDQQELSGSLQQRMAFPCNSSRLSHAGDLYSPVVAFSPRAPLALTEP